MKAYEHINVKPGDQIKWGGLVRSDKDIMIVLDPSDPLIEQPSIDPDMFVYYKMGAYVSGINPFLIKVEKTMGKYGEAYEKRGIVPGDVFQTSSGKTYTIIAPNDHKVNIDPDLSGDGDRFIYAVKSGGYITGYNPWFFDSREKIYVESKSEVVTSDDSIFCICGGQSKPIKYTTFSFNQCVVCKKEKR